MREVYLIDILLDTAGLHINGPRHLLGGETDGLTASRKHLLDDALHRGVVLFHEGAIHHLLILEPQEKEFGIPV